MSTSKGNTVRKRPQKHQNKTAFRNNLHDSSNKTKFINSLNVAGVCKRCKDIIDWKIKYKKYKVLTATRKCVGCDQKAIKHAYHVLCAQCSKDRNVCPKCCKSNEIIPETENETSVDIISMLKPLPERKRRTLMRYIKNQGGEKNMTPEIMAHIEELISKVENVSIGSNEDEFDDSSEDLEEEE